MPRVAPPTPHSVLDDLHASLDHVLTTLNQKWVDTPLTVKPIGPLTVDNERRSFRVDGPGDLSVDVHFAAFPLGDDTVEVQIEVENGPIRRFVFDPSTDAAEAASEKDELGRKVSSFLLHEIEPHLGKRSDDSSSAETSRYVPQIDLTRQGLIKRFNEAARSVLEYGPDDTVDENFFSHIDGHNLRRVMRDLAQMVSDGMKRARWLIRMQTGNDRWQWFRVAARNELRTRGIIRVHLRPLN